MNRATAKALIYDIVCVMTLVIIGTRNHDTDTGVSGIMYVAAPFLIATLASRVLPDVRRSVGSLNAGVQVWVTVVVLGMILRNAAFDRGTAAAFVIVATVFLGITMNGWRAISERRRA
jgi:hypothetical protein